MEMLVSIESGRFINYKPVFLSVLQQFSCFDSLFWALSYASHAFLFTVKRLAFE